MKPTTRQLQARAQLETMGYSISGACALAGNFCQESGPDLPSAFRKGRLDHGSQGLPQWRLQRLTNYQNYVRGLPSSRNFDEARLWTAYGIMNLQLEFVDQELRTDYPLLREKLMRGGDVAALTADVCWQYERPSAALSGIDKRIDYAKALAAVVMTTRNPLAGDMASVSVVDHLQAVATQHATQQQGGAATAAIAGLGALALGATHFVQDAGVWGYVGLGGLLAATAVGAFGSIAAGHKAATVRQAIAGVTPDAPKADDVEHAEVSPPPAPVEVQPSALTPVPMSAEEVERIVTGILARNAALVSANNPVSDDPLHPSNAGTEVVGLQDRLQSGRGDVKGNDATMTIGRQA